MEKYLINYESTKLYVLSGAIVLGPADTYLLIFCLQVEPL